MMQRYSFFALARHAVNGHSDWPRAIAASALKPTYDAIIVGGGGHGLATAYFLGKEHRIGRIAVIEKGAIGQGNSGRNTQITRSDYFNISSSRFFERSLRLYEGLGPRIELQHHAEPARKDHARAQPARARRPCAARLTRYG